MDTKYRNFLTYRAIRVNSNLNQEEWAARLNVSKRTVNNWENGKGNPTMSTLVKMSELSDIPIDFFCPNN